ncbi:MAG: uroporphyrinogen decarboxylase family protein [Faecalibacillus sp.]
MDMNQWLMDLRMNNHKKTMPILTFPAIQELNITVDELVKDANLQVKAMKYINDTFDPLAILGLMDLSVEAENFGSKIRYEKDSVPTVVGRIIYSEDDAIKLEIPDVYQGRTRIFIEAIQKIVEDGIDKPVFPGVIGPFSLAGRLMDVSEAMICCYDDPDMLHIVLQKVSQMITNYIYAFKEAGASGVVMAEPLAGLLSPALVKEFSCDYVKKIIEKVSDDNFIVIYHNCGNNTVKMIDDLLEMKAAIYHFGNSIDIVEILKKVPHDVIIMGNIDPVKEFKDGTVESMVKATKELLIRCKDYNNFVISSGCDIPALASLDNIKAYFDTVKNFK